MTPIRSKFAQAARGHAGAAQLPHVPLPPEQWSPAVLRQAKVDEPVVLKAAADALGVGFCDSLNNRPVSSEFLARIPIAFARRHTLIGLSGEDGVLEVVLSDVAQWPQARMLARMLDKKVRIRLALANDILRAVNAAYQQQAGQTQKLIEKLDDGTTVQEIGDLAGNEDLLDVASRAPVIQLVNLTLLEAVKRRASDVHVQPYEDQLIVRFRIDGVLHDVFTPPKALQPEIISRIKIMGGMNIAEQRVPQDGRATVEIGDRLVDLRISTLPTSFGERAVLRLLDKSIRLFELNKLGMPPSVLEGYRRLIHNDHGIMLVTGPTGSGKTTTLYAALQELNSKEMNILTLEDPIEYRLHGISQTQVSERKGMSFAGGLRSVLRQDPDIIMVGEIRDVDTAHMAIQSALTGHLVFSTLHTNDAAGAVARMLDLGVEPYLLASSLLGVLAQRLVRQICPACRMEFSPAPEDFLRWGLAPDPTLTRLYRGKGCPACLGTGYRERVGIFELLTVTEPIREMILRREKASSIKEAATKHEMISLYSHGMDKALQGETTMEEVVRVASREF